MSTTFRTDLEHALALIRGVYNELPAGSSAEEHLLDAETHVHNAQLLLQHQADPPRPEQPS